MKRLFSLILPLLFIAVQGWGASFSYSGSRPVGSNRSSIDTAYVGKNVEIVRDDSCFVLNLNGKEYVLSRVSFSRLVDENVWMEGFGIKDKIYTLFFDIDNGKSILKNFAIREKNGTSHIFRAEDDPLQWTYVPTIFINSASFAYRDKKGKIISKKFDSHLGTNTMGFLVVKIACQSLSPGERVDLKVKVIDPKGNILRNASSPEGYTFSASVVTSDTTLHIADRILTWDDQRGIVPRAGNYKVEIYDENALLNTSTLYLGRPYVSITGPVYETCPYCRGTGKDADSGNSQPCPFCSGRGKIYIGDKTVIKSK